LDEAAQLTTRSTKRGIRDNFNFNSQGENANARIQPGA
jgi:hypothetical protein